jgi:hypothetical protein
VGGGGGRAARGGGGGRAARGGGGGRGVGAGRGRGGGRGQGGRGGVSWDGGVPESRGVSLPPSMAATRLLLRIGSPIAFFFFPHLPSTHHFCAD